MKPNFTHSKSISRWLLFAAAVFPITTYSQPDYDFRNHILISGTDLQVGAVYLFPTVKPGVDAIMTLTHISSGVTVVEMDGSSGFPEALQPTLDVSPFTSGYLEMRFDLVVAGTSTPSVQTEVPVTCIDVDGWLDNDGLGNPLHEFDEIDLGGGYVNYQLTGGELTMSQSGTSFNGRNNGGLDYPGRDTSARQVMFTVVNGNISSFTIRVGVDNSSTVAAQRLRSIYFKKFAYPNSVLSKSSLVFFQGREKNQNIELQWRITQQHNIRTVVVEKGNRLAQFSAIGEVSPNVSAGQVLYEYQDTQPNEGNIYYRLKIIYLTGKITYSNTVAFYSKDIASELLIYPSVVQGSATVYLKSERAGIAQIQLVDYSGRVVSQKNIPVYAGTNNIAVNDFTSLHPGNYLVIVRINEKVYNQKIFKP